MKSILIHKLSIKTHALTIPCNHLNYVVEQFFKHRAQLESEVPGTTVSWGGTHGWQERQTPCPFPALLVNRWVTLSKLFNLSDPQCFNL